MLTADLVRVHRRGDALLVRPLSAKMRPRALEITERFVEAARACLADPGQTRADFEARCAAVEIAAGERWLAAGLLKLVDDRCTFEMTPGVDPPALRRALFQRAAEARREDVFDRTAVLQQVAADRAIEPAELERQLFADLRDAHRLVKLRPLSAQAIVDGYDLSQAQAVLLRASWVRVEVRADHPAAYRALFHKLKFLQLLYTLEPIEAEGYRLKIDGPFSLFQAATRYGLKLAQLLPALQACGAWTLEAEVRWYKGQPPLRFQMQGDAPQGGDRQVRLADDVARLLASFKKLETPWRAATARRVLHLPGAGVCVPDLVFTHRESKRRVYLEVMGFWSRKAVWRRVELVTAGLKTPILFAVSSHLRVSEKVLDEALPSAIHVYKRVISPRRIAEHLEQLVER